MVSGGICPGCYSSFAIEIRVICAIVGVLIIAGCIAGVVIGARQINKYDEHKCLLTNCTVFNQAIYEYWIDLTTDYKVTRKIEDCNPSYCWELMASICPEEGSITACCIEKNNPRDVSIDCEENTGHKGSVILGLCVGGIVLGLFVMLAGLLVKVSDDFY